MLALRQPFQHALIPAVLVASIIAGAAQPDPHDVVSSFEASHLIKIATADDAERVRKDLIAFVWKGRANLDRGARPDTIEETIKPPFLTRAIRNASQWQRLTTRMEKGLESRS